MGGRGGPSLSSTEPGRCGQRALGGGDAGLHRGPPGPGHTASQRRLASTPGLQLPPRLVPGRLCPGPHLGWHRGLRQAPTLLEAGALGSHLPGRLCTEVCRGRWSPAGVASPPALFPSPETLPGTFESSQQARLCPSEGLPPALPSTGRPAAPWDRPHSLALGLGGLWPPGHTPCAPDGMRTDRTNAGLRGQAGGGGDCLLEPRATGHLDLGPPTAGPSPPGPEGGGGQVATGSGQAGP